MTIESGIGLLFFIWLFCATTHIGGWWIHGLLVLCIGLVFWRLRTDGD